MSEQPETIAQAGLATAYTTPELPGPPGDDESED